MMLETLSTRNSKSSVPSCKFFKNRFTSFKVIIAEANVLIDLILALLLVFAKTPTTGWDLKLQEEYNQMKSHNISSFPYLHQHRAYETVRGELRWKTTRYISMFRPLCSNLSSACCLIVLIFLPFLTFLTDRLY